MFKFAFCLFVHYLFVAFPKEIKREDRQIVYIYLSKKLARGCLKKKMTQKKDSETVLTTSSSNVEEDASSPAPVVAMLRARSLSPSRRYDGENDEDGDDFETKSAAFEDEKEDKNITMTNEEGGEDEDKLPPKKTKKVVKEKNMNTIYVKTDANAASLDVAVPTSAMVEGGTEIRLFITVIFLLFAFVFPAFLLLRNLVSSVLVGSEKLAEDTYLMTKAISSFSALVLLLSPLYVNWRYSFGFWNALFMNIRGLFTPFLFILAVAPKEFLMEQRELAFGLGFGFYVLLKVYRRMCRGEPIKEDGKMRVLFIGDAVPPKVDGVSTFAEHAMENFLRKGHQLHLITSIDGPKTFFEKCEVTRLPGMTTPISPGHSITLPLPTVFKTFVTFKPHCVHLFEVSPLNLATFVYCQVADIPVTFSHHTRLDLYINIVTPQFPQTLNAMILFTLERVFYPLVDAHLCVSKVLFEKVKNRGTKNVRFWDSGVNKRFDRSKFDAHTRSEFSSGDVQLPLVCHVGRLGPEKNSEEIPEIIYETWKLMKGQVRFAIVGGGILKEQVEKEIKEKFNISKCSFPGFLRGLQLEQAYASCDVFFSPSTTEGFPLVFLEAMASGLAVVGPIAGGIPDGFTEGVEGCLYEPHNVKDAARAIKRAIDGGDVMREKAYARGKSFSWERSIDQLEDLLKLVVQARQQSGLRGWWTTKPTKKVD